MSEASPKTPDTTVKFVLRASAKNHKKLQTEAKRRSLSINQLINEKLEASFISKKSAAVQIKELATQL